MSQDGADCIDIFLLGLKDAEEECTNKWIFFTKVDFIQRLIATHFRLYDLLDEWDQEKINAFLLSWNHDTGIKFDLTWNKLLICVALRRQQVFKVALNFFVWNLRFLVHVYEVTRVTL